MSHALKPSRSSLFSSIATLGCLSLLITACSERDDSKGDEQGIQNLGKSSEGAGTSTGGGPNPGTSAPEKGPETPEPQAQVTGIMAGDNSSCALLSNGMLRCWGDNGYGQLGLGHQQMLGLQPGQMGASLPTLPLPPGVKLVDVKPGETTCARGEDQALYCWGRNSQGQLGKGNNQDRGDNPGEMGKGLLSVPLGPNLKVTDHCVGQGHVCAVLGEGQVKCWGRNSTGQLGRGNVDSVGAQRNQMGEQLAFVDLGTEGDAKVQRRATKISCGAQHTCVLTTDHKVLCWGVNDKSQLGNANTQNVGDQANEMGNALVAVPFSMPSKIVDIQSAQDHNCVLTDAGTVHCWGNNKQGQLGLGHTNPMGSTSAEVSALYSGVDLGSSTPVTQMAVGGAHVCALTSDAKVRCWGANRMGELGAGPVQTLGSAPDQMGAKLPVLSLGQGFTPVQISAGAHHSCARDKAGAVRCWGLNLQGQLGLGDQVDRGTQAAQMGDALPLVKVLP